MPSDGLMAFCTFYDSLDRLQLSKDGFDYQHKGMSGLTRLHFRLKDTVASRADLVPDFSVTLYPDSAFFMPLSTNRLYTHEIKPSGLDARLLPTRLGYVVRCSNREALHVNGVTYLKDSRTGELMALQQPTPEGMKGLRRLYAQENLTDELVEYGDKFQFSMNKGDYACPTVRPMSDHFQRLELNPLDDWFTELMGSVEWEDVGKGRQGVVLVKPGTRGIPVVRTTTRYSAAAQCFGPTHDRLAARIREGASLDAEFNNVLVENYTNRYTTMGFHSDQAQDLQNGTHIALFSCYQSPELAHTPRKLVVESKGTDGGGTFEIPLLHNSVVVWSLDTNRRFRHKIVLDTSGHRLPENLWLGLTFRTSSTHVQIREDGVASFEDGTPLALADDVQKREFYKLRGAENRSVDFVWPKLGYTISESDTVLPCTSLSGAESEGAQGVSSSKI
eukprot:TRINITY_DN27450_c0_g1_i5.p1 TRINITY_DN27450_c0_g1~~TRINITY_DN27450_c0_g1_i5.p1  ORF type:complete len:446 (-),score=77.47 TRINITY_DN27450_c0_g1_i5:233-1570(-)